MKQFGMLLAGLVFAGAAMAADRADFGPDMAAFAPTAPAMATSGDCDYLTSMKKNARITIGGDVVLLYAFSHNSGPERTFGNRWLPGNRTLIESNWGADKADLTLKAYASDCAYLTMTLALNDSWDGKDANDRDYLLKELYFTFENVCGSGFGLKAGKQEVPFGMDKDELAIHPYLDSLDNSYLRDGTYDIDHGNGIRYGTYVKESNFLESNFLRPSTGSTSNYDRTFALVPYFNIGDKAKIELAWFQDPAGRGLNKRKTDDPGLSFAAKATVTPIEDLELSASVITRYLSSREGDDTTDRMYGSSLAFDWNPSFFCKKFNVFGEWQHGWKPEFRKHTSSDDIHAGISFDMTEAFTVYAQYEWLRMREKNDRHYARQAQRAILAGKYTFGSGIYAEAGYQREWGCEKGWTVPGEHRGINANVLYTALGWQF